MKCQGPPWQYIGTIFQRKGPLELFAICYFVPRKKQSQARSEDTKKKTQARCQEKNASTRHASPRQLWQTPPPNSQNCSPRRERAARWMMHWASSNASPARRRFSPPQTQSRIVVFWGLPRASRFLELHPAVRPNPTAGSLRRTLQPPRGSSARTFLMSEVPL